ncbi:MAG: ATP-binding protein, partial [Proteobacteria bacterium]|nr:ATP-binding protein [Pseudomonadota bacterium]
RLHRPEDWQPFFEAFEERRPYRDLTIKRVDQGGPPQWIRSNGVPVFDTDGNFKGFRGTGSDITDRIRTEEALRASEQALQRSHDELETRVAERTQELLEATGEAERANQAKSEFLSSMSHELRTPLNAILGFSQLMAMETDLKDDLQLSVDEISKAGHHLLHLVTEILDLARIETGHMELNFEIVTLAPLIEEALSLIGPSAAARSVSSIYESRGNESVTVWSDPMRLRQVLLNFLSNAVKYNREGGTVVAWVEPGAKEGSWRILVRDTGAGIANEDRAKVFEAFNRLGRNNSAIEGTGIGMTVSRQIAEAMGASLDFESEVGVGSTFWLELPGST